MNAPIRGLIGSTAAAVLSGGCGGGGASPKAAAPTAAVSSSAASAVTAAVSAADNALPERHTIAAATDLYPATESLGRCPSQPPPPLLLRYCSRCCCRCCCRCCRCHYFPAPFRQRGHHPPKIAQSNLKNEVKKREIGIRAVVH